LALFFGKNNPIAFFKNVSAAQAYAAQAVRVVSLGYIFYRIGMVLMNPLIVWELNGR